MATATRIFGGFTKSRLLDYGCGTGRLTCAFAKHFGQVVGLDIAEGMLAEARVETAKRGLRNVVYENSAGSDKLARGSYDFVHSYIVLQHIPPQIGYGIFRAMAAALATDGIGAIHLTHADAAGQRFGRLRALAKDILPLRIIGNIAIGRKWNYPAMQMNHYDLSTLFKILVEENVHEVTVHQIDDWGNLGAYLFFRKVDAAYKGPWSNPVQK